MADIRFAVAVLCYHSSRQRAHRLRIRAGV